MNFELAEQSIQYTFGNKSFNKLKNICAIVFLKCYKVCYNLATRW